MKKSITNNNMFTSTDEASFNDTQNITSKSILKSAPKAFVEGFKVAVKEMLKADEQYRLCCSIGKGNYGIKIRSNLVNFLGPQKANTSTNEVGSTSYDKVSNISLFFKEVGIEMDVLRAKNKKKQYKLELHAQKLDELKEIRNSLKIVKDEEPELVEEQGMQMKLKSGKYSGFTSHGSLIIFLAMLYTIVEFAIIIIKVVY